MNQEEGNGEVIQKSRFDILHFLNMLPEKNIRPPEPLVEKERVPIRKIIKKKIQKILGEIIPEKGIVNFIADYAEDISGDDIAFDFKNRMERVEIEDVNFNKTIRVYFKDCEEAYEYNGDNFHGYEFNKIIVLGRMMKEPERFSKFLIEHLEFMDYEAKNFIVDYNDYEYELLIKLYENPHHFVLKEERIYHNPGPQRKIRIYK